MTTTPDPRPRTFIRGLTLHRPWPWAFCFDTKRAENRPWAPRSVEEDGEKHWLLRKPVDGVIEARQSVKLYLAIHAGSTLDREALAYLHDRNRAQGGVIDFDNEPQRIVGVGRLARVLDVWATLPEDPLRAPHEEWIYDPPKDEVPEGRRPYAWILEDFIAFRSPIPAKGAQGLWRLEPDLYARVRKRYAEDLAWYKREGGEG